jgi:hypothetical protein
VAALCRNAGGFSGSKADVRRLWLLLIAACLPACHGGNRQEIISETGGVPPAGPVVTEVSWTRDVWPIIIVRCQVCHTTGVGAEEVPNMRMADSATLYNEWVRVFSQCNPNLFRVLPGRSDLSFVFDKISTEAPLCGQRMPPGPPLEDAEQLVFRTWIDQGALHN